MSSTSVIGDAMTECLIRLNDPNRNIIINCFYTFFFSHFFLPFLFLFSVFAIETLKQSNKMIEIIKIYDLIRGSFESIRSFRLFVVAFSIFYDLILSSISTNKTKTKKNKKSFLYSICCFSLFRHYHHFCNIQHSRDLVLILPQRATINQNYWESKLM